MIVPDSPTLFAWDELEDSPSLQTVKALLAAVPDGPLLAALAAARGHGRNDYPVGVLWGTELLSIVLRHHTMEATLGELRRNEALRRLIGITEGESGVPKKWNMSRFADALGEEPARSRAAAVFAAMVTKLAVAVPALGQQAAGDATALRARRCRSQRRGRRAAAAGPALPEPSGGRKEYTDETGQVVKVVEWFGHKLHLVVDTEHEVALAWELTAANADDGQTLPRVLAQAQAAVGKDRIKTLAFDKAADHVAVHQELKKANVHPVIQQRELWQGEPERLLPGFESGAPRVVYDEAGTVYCYDQVSQPPVRHPLAYIGHEPSRGTIKYRCPSLHENWDCPSCRQCNAGRVYGRTVRVKQELDLRRFPDLPRATKKFERLYKGRTAVERVNGRLKVFWGVDDGNIAGARRMFAHVAAVMIVHLAFATVLAAAPRRRGTLGKLHLGPVQQALRQTAQAVR